MTNDELAEFIVAEVRQYVDTTLLRSIERLESSFAAQVERAVEERIKALPAPEPGAPGKDADLDAIKVAIAEAVAALPLAKDGDPGRDADPEVIRTEVAKAVAALPLPKDGKNGKDIDRAEVDSMVSFAVSLIPPPKNGENGKDADPDVIRAEVAKAVSALPVAKDGADGKDGRDGIDAQPGTPGKDADPEVMRAEVAKAVASLPPPIHGRDGKDADVLVVKALVAGEVAHAIAAQPPPKDGRDGKDGITVEQLEAATLKALAAALGELHLDRRDFKIGDRLIATIPFPLYEKVYQPETDYEPGDMVTFGGDGWHCNKATRDKPGTSDAWTLAIKKGRDFRPIDRKPPPVKP